MVLAVKGRKAARRHLIANAILRKYGRNRHMQVGNYTTSNKSSKGNSISNERNE